MIQHAWTCSCCGRQHSGLPLDFAVPEPHPWRAIPEDQRTSAGHKLDENLCVIGGRDFFIRGCVEIPIVGHHEKFIWGVWASLSESNFKRVLDLWSADVADEPPMFGWLCNNVSQYPPTIGLKTNVHLRPNNLRPAIIVEPTDHPLAVDQREGITLDKVEKLVAALMPHH